MIDPEFKIGNRVRFKGRSAGGRVSPFVGREGFIEAIVLGQYQVKLDEPWLDDLGYSATLKMGYFRTASISNFWVLAGPRVRKTTGFAEFMRRTGGSSASL